MVLPRLSVLLATASLFLGSVCASAAPKIGDRVDFQGTAIDGKAVNSRNLRGKMVLVEFWATWCPICVADTPNVIRLNEQYAPKGLQIVGVSLDEKPEAPMNFAKEKGLTWPQIADKPQRRLQRQFGVEGTPTLFLINPDGVLVWRGGTDGMDAAVAEHMEKTPPRLPRKASDAGAPGAASAAAGADKSTGEKSGGENARARGALSMAAAYRAAGKNDLARQRYQQVIKDFPGTPYAEEAQRELDKLPK